MSDKERERVIGWILTELVLVWESILRRSGARESDDFFQQGGDSLLACHLVTQVRERFAVDVGLQDVYEFPALGQLARVIFERRRAVREEDACSST